MPLLTLDAAGTLATVGVWLDGAVLVRRDPGGQGQAGRLAPLVAETLAAAGVSFDALTAVAVTTGPGSFTGLRTALALAHGIALAAGIPVVAVSVAEALSEALPHRGHRTLWVALDSRRGRVFLDDGSGPVAHELLTLPRPQNAVAVAGDAAVPVAARWATAGVDVMLTDARHPRPQDIVRAATARMEGRLPPRDALPIYVDPPEARPATHVRPAPRG